MIESSKYAPENHPRAEGAKPVMTAAEFTQFLSLCVQLSRDTWQTQSPKGEDNMKTNEFDNPAHALADAWASIDGKLEEFRAGRTAKSITDFGGHFDGYIADAEELIERLRNRGYDIFKLDTAMFAAWANRRARGYTDESGTDIHTKYYSSSEQSK